MSACQMPAGLEDTLRDISLSARQDLEISRHVFAGKVTYILRDPITFESHRFSPVDYEIFVQMMSSLTLGEVFEQLETKQIVDESSKPEYYQFAANLIQLGLLGLPAPDGQTLFARAEARKQAARSGMLKNFLFHQIPLFNPDRFLDRTIHWARMLFSKAFFCIWTIGLIAAIVIVCCRWNDFTDPLADILTLKNLPLLWAILFGLKIFHEFGHAYACKHFGGSVPAMGVYLIAGNPCAFVDASAAWGFPNRMHRILVSLGGMYFESIIGIIGVFVWAFSRSPVLQSCAHHIVFMATAVTLLFNANPLMKYDGYFVLCDLTGSPNLRQRSSNLLNALLKRWLLGIGDAEETPFGLRPFLLITYGIASSMYKFVVVISISSMVAAKFALLGLGMAGFYILSTIYGMYSSALRYLWTSAEVQPVYKRARSLGVALAASAPLILLMPVPTAIRSTGRLSSANEIEITNETSGMVRTILAHPGQQVATNQPIVFLENENVVSQFEQDAAMLEESTLAVNAQKQIDRIEAAKTTNRMNFLDHRFDLANQRLESLTVSSDRDGVVMSCLPQNQTGQFLPEGTTIAVVASGRWQVRFLADAATISAARPRVGMDVPMRLKSQAGKQLAGTIVRIAKIGDRQVQDESLTHLAGGNIAVNPVTREASEAYFEIVVELDEQDNDAILLHGQTVEVRMNRRLELVAQSLYRSVTNFINQVMTG